MMVKLLYGCCIMPMIILLPVYMRANLDHRPRRAVLICMLGIPLLTVIETVRTAHTRDSDGIVKRMGVVMFLLIVRLWFDILFCFGSTFFNFEEFACRY